MTIQNLEHIITSNVDEKQKIDALNQLAWKLRNSNPQQGLLLAEEAQQRAKSGEFEEQVYGKGIAHSLRNLAWITFYTSRYDLALSYAFKAIPLLESLALKTELADILRVIGAAHQRFGNYPTALDYCLKSLKLAEDLEDKKKQAKSLNNMMIIYDNLGEYSLALKTFQTALKIHQEIGNKFNEALLLNNVVTVYMAMNDPDNALNSGLESLKIAKETNNKQLEANVLDTLGATHLEIGNYKEAIGFLEQCLQISELIDNKLAQATALYNMGKVYKEQQNIKVALSYLHQALDISIELGTKMEIFSCHQTLAELYKIKGDFEKALTHHEQFHLIKSAMFNETADNKLKGLQVIHDTETTKREAEIYQLKNVALEQEINERKRVEIALQEANEQLAKLNDDKDKFFAIVSHDLRSAFNILLGSSIILRQKAKVLGHNELWQLAKNMYTTVNAAHNLLENLLSWARMQEGQMAYNPEAVPLHEVADSTITLLTEMATRKNITFNHTIAKGLVVTADRQMLDTVMRNLSSNALKFTPQGGQVNIIARLITNNTINDNKTKESSIPSTQPSWVEVSICDTGVGISKEDQKKLFKINTQHTTQGTHEEKGTGLGLLLCQEMIKKNGGTISVKSQLNQGTKMIFTLPLDTSNSILTQSTASPQNSPVKTNHPQKDIILPSITHLTKLLELGLRGDMQGIEKQATKIEATDKQFAPFTRTLIKFAQQFEDEAIITLLEKYINQTQQ